MQSKEKRNGNLLSPRKKNMMKKKNHQKEEKVAQPQKVELVMQVPMKMQNEQMNNQIDEEV